MPPRDPPASPNPALAGDPATLIAIPARSQRQAMDWSLVLASQGIEPVIHHDPLLGRWSLWVPPADVERAAAAIRQYRIENRRWRWRQDLGDTGLVFHWAVLFWAWGLIVVHWLASAFGGRLEAVGAMNSAALRDGEWWRLFTATLLHADAGHLAANLSTGLVTLGLAMARFGPGTALLLAAIAGAAGNLLGFALRSDPYVGLGASGVVLGALGLLAGRSVESLRDRAAGWRTLLSGLGAGVLLFILLGLDPASDVLAHAGGFAAGLTLGLAWTALPRDPVQTRWADRLAGSLALALIASTWIMAFAFARPHP